MSRDLIDPTAAGDHDAVDALLGQWRRERPDLDASSVEVIGRLQRVARLLEREMRDFFVSRGHEPWEYDVLAALRRQGPPYELSGSALLPAMLVSPGAITNRIDRMIAKGLVERRTDPTSRRSMLIRLTEHGRQTVDALVDGHMANQNRLLVGLNGADRAQIVVLLRKLLLSLDDRAGTARDAPEPDP
jgi:DNA-binding MarR family transcriptional regulator